MNRFLLISMFVISVFVAGCTYDLSEPAKIGDHSYYFVRENTSFGEIGKVALFEPVDVTCSQNLSLELMDSLAREMRKLHIFSVMPVEKSQPFWHDFEGDSSGGYKAEQLTAMRKSLGVNAIVFGEITQYESFPKMNIGLRLRMLDLRSGKILWGVEQVWDVSDRSTQRRIDDYYKTSLKHGYEPLGAEIVEVSPRAFNKFIAYEIATTVPRGYRRW